MDNTANYTNTDEQRKGWCSKCKERSVMYEDNLCLPCSIGARVGEKISGFDNFKDASHSISNSLNRAVDVLFSKQYQYGPMLTNVWGEAGAEKLKETKTLYEYLEDLNKEGGMFYGEATNKYHLRDQVMILMVMIDANVIVKVEEEDTKILCKDIPYFKEKYLKEDK